MAEHRAAGELPCRIHRRSNRQRRANSEAVTLTGEGALLLWMQGNPEAALQLEELLDHWIHEKNISTFCSYPVKCFGRKNDRELLVKLGALPDSVVPAQR
jgi:hypothetical protein